MYLIAVPYRLQSKYCLKETGTNLRIKPDWLLSLWLEAQVPALRGVPKLASPQNETIKPSVPLLVFTDLDGMLIGHETYSWEAARPALNPLRTIGAGTVLASSKTAPENDCPAR